MSKSILTEAGAKAIRERKTFQPHGIQPWMMAYRTEGGTYILASDGGQSDSGKPRDNLAILPDGTVIELWPFLNPEFVTEVKAVLS